MAKAGKGCEGAQEGAEQKTKASKKRSARMALTDDMHVEDVNLAKKPQTVD